MAAKPGITIVGAGNLASALAISLHRAGYAIDQIIARSGGASLQRARALARKVESQAADYARSRADSELVWFCVPDATIASAARSITAKTNWKIRVAVHSSGALDSDALKVFRKRGTEVASAHPLMTFVAGSRPSLAGIPFAIEGEPKAVRLVRRVVKDMRGVPFSIQKKDKAAYHAWGTFASPLLTALLATAEEVAHAAGAAPKSAKQRMLPIVAQTIANYAALGASASFSGPFVRGDVETIRMHLQVLRRVPAAREVYVALGKAALKYLPAKKRRTLAETLDA
jgi:predicted short-subunit dehydrogenase-like oxidoreductase (DUF2520 family)